MWVRVRARVKGEGEGVGEGEGEGESPARCVTASISTVDDPRRTRPAQALRGGTLVTTCACV